MSSDQTANLTTRVRFLSILLNFKEFLGSLYLLPISLQNRSLFFFFQKRSRTILNSLRKTQLCDSIHRLLEEILDDKSWSNLSFRVLD